MGGRSMARPEPQVEGPEAARGQILVIFELKAGRPEPQGAPSRQASQFSETPISQQVVVRYHSETESGLSVDTKSPYQNVSV